MKRLRSKLTYANVMVTVLAFLVLGGAAAYGATQLAKNSVGTAQLKRHAVRAGKLAPQSVGNAALTKGIKKKLAKGGPVGPQGPPGPQGPGATRIHLSQNGTEGATPQTIATIGGLTLKAACDTTAGETGLVFALNAQEAGVIQENFQNDTGSDPHSSGPIQAGNLEIDLPAGETVLGGPPPVSSGSYFRIVVSLIFTTAKQTTSIQLVSLTEGTTAHCTADGVGVVASG